MQIDSLIVTRLGKLLELETDKIGKIEYKEEDRYSMPSGLYGFPDEKAYIFHPSENVTPFSWLQSEENTALSFLILDPLLTYPDFQLTLSKADLPDLELEDGDEHKVYVIATVPEDPSKITLNLQGPLIFNLTKRLVQQVVIEDQDLQAPLLRQTST